MTQRLGQLLNNIGTNFTLARTQKFAEHPLAIRIRSEWPEVVRTLVSKDYGWLKFPASAGQGQWNSSPWLAVLHPALTSSAQEGYYPVFLFEEGFQTVCLVMGQGAQKLEAAVGKGSALVELAERARLLRASAKNWQAAGFSAGPFATMREPGKGGSGVLGKVSDPWAVSVAFGKRYQLSSMPDDAVLASDLRKMLKIYCELASQKTLNTTGLDTIIADMAATGELPGQEEAGLDGVKRVARHKQFEYRVRNRALIDKVKAKLGSVCQACDFNFPTLYGENMNGFIEAHHTVPISKLADSGAKLNATEDHFMVLCSNCHRAIHAAGCPTLEEFRESLKGRLKVLS